MPANLAYLSISIMLTLIVNLCIITKYQVGRFRIEEPNDIYEVSPNNRKQSLIGVKECSPRNR